MRARRVFPGDRVRIVAGAFAFVACGFAAACVDLFHETTFDTLCDFDASAPGCGSDAHAVTIAGDGGSPSGAVDASGLPSDICTLDAAAASNAAEHACAWLSACAGAFGGNAPGECLLHARQALDCRVEPSRPARGPLLAVWRCLATATSCDDVGGCIEPGGAEECPVGDAGAFVACGGTSTNAANASVRIACSGTSAAPTAIETCATGGQTCAVFASGAACGGGGVPNGASNTCAGSGCAGTVLQDCDENGVDRGLDCANVGRGSCAFDRDAGAIGCVTDDGDACAPTRAIICDMNGVAQGCPSGTRESVDCAELTGSPSCDPNAGGRPWDVSRACDAGAGCLETCTNNVLTACVGGAATTLDCKAQGLSGCSYTEVSTSAGTEMHPTCVR